MIEIHNKIKAHPTLTQKLSTSQKATDALTKWMGSWVFIILFICLLALWILINVYFLIEYKLGKPWDPYPFILLNLVLSSLATIQAPIILMSQNRQAQKDRIRAEYDYQVNRKAEREIEEIQRQLRSIENKLA